MSGIDKREERDRMEPLRRNHAGCGYLIVGHEFSKELDEVEAKKLMIVLVMFVEKIWT